MRHSPDERAMEDQFRKLWSLKEVSWMGRAGVCVCVCAMEDQFRKLWSLKEV